MLFTPDGQEDRVGTFFNGSFQCDNLDHHIGNSASGA